MSQAISDTTEKIEQHRDELEALAESELPCREIAEKVLEVAEG